MVRISEGDFQRQWDKIQHMAIAEPVTITSNGHDSMVILSAEEYHRLTRRDRRVMTLADFTDEDIEAIRKVQPSAEAIALNYLMKD